jgi:hypothetical protein
MLGPELGELAVDPSCAVILASDEDEDPSSYDNHEWITATHTIDGETVHALVHNEYQGWRHFPSECTSERGCWFNAITLATSVDGGASYRHRPPPAHRVATFPYRYASNTGPAGFFMPSNIVEKDGFHYALVRALNGPRQAAAYPAQQRGNCLIRTRDLSDPGAWRAWDGEDFTVAFADPYREEVDPRRHVAPTVSVEPPAGREHPPEAYGAGEMTESLTYNTHFGQYLLAGIARKPDPAGGDPVWGVYYSLSSDLVHWGERQLLAEARPFYLPHPDCTLPDPILYPAVLDPSSPDRNFGTTGKANELFFTVFHYKLDARGRCVRDGKNRDLVKLRFEFD